MLEERRAYRWVVEAESEWGVRERRKKETKTRERKNEKKEDQPERRERKN